MYLIAGEDVLSLDVAFIDRSWNYIVKNLGVIHCKEGTSGDQVAAALRPTLDRHKLKERVYAYVKDQGSNLKTTAKTLSNSLEVSMNVCCRALGQSKPYAGNYAHICLCLPTSVHLPQTCICGR